MLYNNTVCSVFIAAVRHGVECFSFAEQGFFILTVNSYSVSLLSSLWYALCIQ